jgi:exosortase A-associated hydrolase 2
MFVDASRGRRFCVLHEPPKEVPCRRGVIYVHPFGEEMNKSRHMAALQSRRLAQNGCVVLQIDLYGCGDSEGEFADARWEDWKQDIEAARSWLGAMHRVPISLWGLRLGGLLAAQVAAESPSRHDSLVLWQPVVNGELFVNQFLRLRVATEMLSGGERRTTEDLRARLAAGEAIEISGYTLAPALAQAMAEVRLDTMALSGTTVDWFEIVDDVSSQPSPAVQRIQGALGRQGAHVSLRTAVGEPFWQTIEIAECEPLLELTTDAVASLQ